MAKKKVKKPYWLVEATYPFTWKYPNVDARITRAVGRASAGSGAGFGERDISFEYATPEGARNAASRIRRLRIKGCKVFVGSYDV